MKNWLIVAAAVVAVLAALWLAGQGMDLSAGAEMSFDGYAAMVMGAILTLAVGVVLMWLVFYSSRHGYDAPAEEDRREPKDDKPPSP
ncbi:hypothetical protein [Rhodoligotrophos defluvii]|uniref:hypothetical protein n=1 Tax=Rhodoligotrophos defluvii TaxID=2561934 RepID=UPI0010C98DFF|nr:hypothetical protein [Rhodoligotrophos defluvii]